MWYILMSATSLVRVIVFLADRSAIHHQPTYTLCGQTCQKYKQLSFKWPSLQHITSQLKKILIKVIHPNVSDLPGHLLEIVLAVHDVVNVNFMFEMWLDWLKVLTTFMSTTITTAYYSLENCNWCDTSQRPPWSSPPCCCSRPHCCRPPNHMSKK